jgi:hypothetical protein
MNGLFARPQGGADKNRFIVTTLRKLRRKRLVCGPRPAL